MEDCLKSLYSFDEPDLWFLCDNACLCHEYDVNEEKKCPTSAVVHKYCLYWVTTLWKTVTSTATTTTTPTTTTKRLASTARSSWASTMWTPPITTTRTPPLTKTPKKFWSALTSTTPTTTTTTTTQDWNPIPETTEAGFLKSIVMYFFIILNMKIYNCLFSCLKHHIEFF